MQILLISLTILVLGGCLALATGWQNRLSHALGTISAVTGSVVGLWGCFLLTQAGTPQDFSVLWATAGVTLSLRVDTLSLFFLLPIFLLTLCCAIYATSYLHGATRKGQYGYHWFFFNLLAASMVLVVTAANGLFFLVAWEIMSLSSFFLVSYDYAEEEVRKAGWLYLIATHCGTIFLFLLLLSAAWKTGSFDFASFTILKTLPMSTAVLFFFCALIGFGTKAGLFPLHTWLPDAHTEAPTAGSVILAAILLKMGTYGYVRFAIPLFPVATMQFTPFLAFLAVVGIIYGALVAMMQDDVKKLVAYSSVSHLGFVMLGVFAMNLQGLSGGMLQMISHGISTGALFPIVGFLYERRHTRLIVDLGGFSKVMPVFATIFLIVTFS